MKFEEIFGLINVLIYIGHAIVFGLLASQQKKANGTKAMVLILLFLFVLLFVSLQVGGFLGGLIFYGKEMNSKVKALHDTIVLLIGTAVEIPVWTSLLRKKKGKLNETENNRFDSSR